MQTFLIFRFSREEHALSFFHILLRKTKKIIIMPREIKLVKIPIQTLQKQRLKLYNELYIKIRRHVLKNQGVYLKSHDQ